MKRFLLWIFLPCLLFAQTNNARMLSGVNIQIGTTYPFVPSDATRLVVFNNASPVAATLPSGATSGFGIGNEFAVQNIGAGTVTITCSGCLIFSTNSAGASTLSLSQGQGADIYSAGQNYFALAVTSGGTPFVPSANIAFTGLDSFSQLLTLTSGAAFGSGTNAAVIGYTQGTTNAAGSPCTLANTQCVQAPTAVTPGVETRNGTYAPGTFFLSGTSSAVQDNYSGSFGVVKALNQTAAIATSTLCAAVAGTGCGQVGQYRLTYNMWGSGTACANVTAGAIQLQFTWTDEFGVNHSAFPAPTWDTKLGGMAAQMNFNTSLSFEGGNGSYIISTNGGIIQYAVTYTACTTGTGTFNLRITTEQLQ